jgi:CRP/FNR family transcriptional regulator
MKTYPPSRLDSEQSCAKCAVRANGFCASLTPADLELMSGIKQARKTLPAGSTIYEQGEICNQYFLVLEGWVAIYVNLEEGFRHIVDFALPGDFFGGGPFQDGAMPHAAESITTVRVCPIPKRRMDASIHERPGLGARLSHVAACHEARAHDHLINISRRGARERIAHLLLELFYRRCHRLPSLPRETIPFPLTLDHIGDALGLSSEHVSRRLRLLREEEIVTITRRRLEILDPEALIRAGGFDGAVIDYDSQNGRARPALQAGTVDCAA